MIPRGYSAVLSALRFDRPDTTALQNLSDIEWKDTLALCDRTQLTLLLALRCPAALPPAIRARIESNLASNREKTRRLEQEVSEVLALLASNNLDPVILKGFAHSPDFLPDPVWRVQFDLDLWLAREQALAARAALGALGYEPLEKMERFPTDHLPVLIRRTEWQWRGDFFDPGAPLSIDLHFRLWDWETEGFDAPGWQLFRDRCIRHRQGSLEFAALHPADAFAYASLHALRHLLRGSLRPFHVYEIASFLHARAHDDHFWQEWSEDHEEGLRRSEAILMALAVRWFGAELNTIATAGIDALPHPVHDWLERYSDAPLEALVVPNKHELWLHLSLLDSPRSARPLLLRRLFPVSIPASVDSSVLLPDAKVTRRIRLRRAWRYVTHFAARAVHHARTFPVAALHGAAWLARGAGILDGFARYLATSCLFSSGVFVFLILYNLHLLGLGFRENFLGQVSAAQTIGSIAGTLPAGWVAHRFGLRTTLLVTLALVAAVSAVRAVVVHPAALLAGAFAGGIALSGWAVQFMPAVAQLTTPRGRAGGFSLFAAVGIATGAVAGLLGGRIPGWIAFLSPSSSEFETRRWTLLLGSVLVMAALIPARKLGFQRPAERDARSYPATPFVLRFLAAISVFHLATGAFNSFFNAWLARHVGASVQATGTIFSASQLTQVAALLAAPAVLRRLGVIRGVAAMQAATGICLGVCAAAVGIPFAGAAYVAYMAAQYMSEPGMFTLLMDRVPESQRSGASALHFLAVYVTHAVAALSAGAAYTHFGYPPVLLVAALVTLAGAFLFRRLAPSASVDGSSIP
jgi:MFS family permease